MHNYSMYKVWMTLEYGTWTSQPLIPRWSEHLRRVVSHVSKAVYIFRATVTAGLIGPSHRLTCCGYDCMLKACTILHQ